MDLTGSNGKLPCPQSSKLPQPSNVPQSLPASLLSSQPGYQSLQSIMSPSGGLIAPRSARQSSTTKSHTSLDLLRTVNAARTFSRKTALAKTKAKKEQMKNKLVSVTLDSKDDSPTSHNKMRWSAAYQGDLNMFKYPSLQHESDMDENCLGAKQVQQRKEATMMPSPSRSMRNSNNILGFSIKTIKSLESKEKEQAAQESKAKGLMWFAEPEKEIPLTSEQQAQAEQQERRQALMEKLEGGERYLRNEMKNKSRQMAWKSTLRRNQLQTEKRGQTQRKRERRGSKQRSNLAKSLELNQKAKNLWVPPKKLQENARRAQQAMDSSGVYDDLRRNSELRRSSVMSEMRRSSMMTDGTSLTDFPHDVFGLRDLHIPKGPFVQDNTIDEDCSEISSFPRGIGLALQKYRKGASQRSHLYRHSNDDMDMHEVDSEGVSEEQRKEQHMIEKQIKERVRNERFFRIYHRAAPALDLSSTGMTKDDYIQSYQEPTPQQELTPQKEESLWTLMRSKSFGENKSLSLYNVVKEISGERASGFTEGAVHEEGSKWKASGWAPFVQSMVSVSTVEGPMTSKTNESYKKFAEVSARMSEATHLTKLFNKVPENLQSVNMHNLHLSGAKLAEKIAELEDQRAVKYLCLSENQIEFPVMKVLAKCISSSIFHTITKLDLSNAMIRDTSVTLLFQSIEYCPNLRYLSLQKNKISSKGGEALAEVLHTTILEVLDLSWNDLGGKGINELGCALETHSTLQHLNLSFNGIGDENGQELTAALSSNNTLKTLVLQHTNLGEKTSVVVAKVLAENTCLQELDLSGTAFGNEGGRAVIRTILSGIPCHVIMKQSTFSTNNCIFFDRSHPPEVLELNLNLSQAYDVAVLREVLKLARENPRSSFELVSYQSKAKSRMQPITVDLITTELSGKVEVVEKNTLVPWEPFTSGFLRVLFKFFRSQFDEGDAVSDEVVERALKFLCSASSQQERLIFLRMISQDIVLSTKQLSYMINVLQKDSDHLRPLQTIQLFWTRIVDVQNLMTFLDDTLEPTVDGTPNDQRRQIAKALTYERFGFNCKNPSGHYRLVLSNKPHKETLQLLFDIAVKESEHSQHSSGRNDTSQKGNWSNFRNERMDGKDVTIDLALFRTEAFKTGKVLEFDYVCTTRPPPGAKPMTDFHFDNLIGEKLDMNSKMETILQENRLYFVACTQLYVAGSYFITPQVIRALDIIEQCKNPSKYEVQVQIILAFFAHIVDLWNFNDILQSVSNATALMIVRQVGMLNIWNPLKPTMTYSLDLRFHDERLALRRIMDLALSEHGNWIRNEPGSQISFVDLYAIKARVENWVRELVIKFRYCEVGEMLEMKANWPSRQQHLSHVLLGSQPIPMDVFRPIQMVKEMEANGWEVKQAVETEYMMFQEVKQGKMSMHQLVHLAKEKGAAMKSLLGPSQQLHLSRAISSRSLVNSAASTPLISRKNSSGSGEERQKVKVISFSPEENKNPGKISQQSTRKNSKIIKQKKKSNKGKKAKKKKGRPDLG